MSNIDRAGTFRGDVIDRGISESSGGFPQCVVQLRATEKYNDMAEVWEDWSQYEETEATGYFVLFGANGKPTLNVRQCMKAFNWDGASFLALQENPNLADKVQWRMESQTYENTERIKVVWIDAYDAEPGRKVQKLEIGDIKKLDAKYAAALKALGGGPKPKSAVPTPPVQSVCEPRHQPAPDPTTTLAPEAVPPTPALPTEKPKRRRATKAEMEARRAAEAAAVQGTSSTPVAPPKTEAPVVVENTTATQPITQAEAWETVCKLALSSGKSADEITAAWTKIVTDLGGDAAVGEDWSGVAVMTRKELGL